MSWASPLAHVMHVYIYIHTYMHIIYAYRLYYIYMCFCSSLPLEKNRRHGFPCFCPFFSIEWTLGASATGHLRAVGFQSFIFWDFNISYFEDDASFNHSWDEVGPSFCFYMLSEYDLKGANSRSEITLKLCTVLVDITLYVCDKHAMYTYMKYILYPMRNVI